MEKLNVDVFFGTMERANEKLVEVPLLDPRSSKFIKGVGSSGLASERSRHIPAVSRLKLYQTEQECGDAKNDWRYCRYAWTVMKDFLENGTNAYCYWNVSLKQGGISRWGWAQNSLVTVDTDAKTFKYNYEYYLIKHFSHFVNRAQSVWIQSACRVTRICWPSLIPITVLSL